MAYKPVQYDFFNPMEELVPLVLIYNKAYQALDKKYEEYMDWLSSSSELLNRDEGAKALKEKYQNDLNIMADALAKGDLRTAHSVDPRKYWYPLKTKQKRAEYLSKHIEDQSKRGSKYAFSKRYDINTPLDENITEAPDWQEYDLDDYVKKGMSIGKELNSTAPLQVGSLFNGALALLRQGVSLEEVYDLLTRSDSELSLRIDDEIRATGITDPIELLKIRNAMGNGILQSVGQSIETHNDPYRSPSEIRARSDWNQKKEEERIEREFNRTGLIKDIIDKGLGRLGEESTGNYLEYNGHRYRVNVVDNNRAKEIVKILHPELKGDEEAINKEAEKYVGELSVYGTSYSGKKDIDNPENEDTVQIKLQKNQLKQQGINESDTYKDKTGQVYGYKKVSESNEMKGSGNIKGTIYTLYAADLKEGIASQVKSIDRAKFVEILKGMGVSKLDIALSLYAFEHNGSIYRMSNTDYRNNYSFVEGICTSLEGGSTSTSSGGGNTYPENLDYNGKTYTITKNKKDGKYPIYMNGAETIYQDESGTIHRIG